MYHDIKIDYNHAVSSYGKIVVVFYVGSFPDQVRQCCAGCRDRPRAAHRQKGYQNVARFVNADDPENNIAGKEVQGVRGCENGYFSEHSGIDIGKRVIKAGRILSAEDKRNVARYAEMRTNISHAQCSGRCTTQAPVCPYCGITNAKPRRRSAQDR